VKSVPCNTPVQFNADQRICEIVYLIEQAIQASAIKSHQ